ncbi:MAG: hypothetical protein QF570_07915 [Myxococcota bacterium]|jgi:hypothetical protein|nr:hypothetical protein [Myxococcota bacterium]
MKHKAGFVAVIALVLATLGWNPFAARRDLSGLLVEDYSEFETGVERQPNGIFLVRALTRMPKVKAKMVRWWFADYMQTTEHYKRWHPTAHIWMDWENKVPGEVVGASHLVHEYIGPELAKLRIQFIPPEELLGEVEDRADRWIICARPGLLEEPINVATMCHIIRDMEWGAEMRSVFWMGDVGKREGNRVVPSLEGVIGNTFLARSLAVDETAAVYLMTHAIQEMGYLADFLPGLYAAETGEGAAR